MIKACSIYFISVSKLYRYCGAMYGLVLGLGLVIVKRDFCFETKTRPSLSYNVLEARPRLMHSRLESRARPLSNELESRARPLSNELELTRDPRLWSRGHKSAHMPTIARAMLSIGVIPTPTPSQPSAAKKQGRCQSCPRSHDQKVAMKCTKCNEWVCGQHGRKEITYVCPRCPLILPWAIQWGFEGTRYHSFSCTQQCYIFERIIISVYC